MRIPLGDYRELLARYLRPQWPRVSALVLLLAASIALQLVSPQIIRSFIDAISRGADDAQLARLAVLFIGAALAQQAAAVAATYFSELVGWRATNALRADLTAHVLRLDLGFHKRRTPGELIERIDGDVTAMANFFAQFVVQLLGNLVFLFGVLVVLWLEDWRAGALVSAFALASLGVMSWLKGVAVPWWREHRQASAELFGFVEERLGGTEDIRARGAEAFVMRGLYHHARERLRTGRKARLLGSIPWSVPIVLFAIGNALSFVLAAFLYWGGSMTLGTAFLVYFYTQQLFRPLHLISNLMEEFQKASAGIVRVRELMATESILPDGPGAPLPTGALGVEFDDVYFGYGEEEAVLQDLTFRIAPGEVVGLLGRTGSGKTTIARLLFRLYDPGRGAVRLGERDVREPQLRELRARVGMVTQDVQLFGGTVRDNLTFFDPSVSDERILAALDALGIRAWVDALPDGLDTVLGAAGRGLSAGEAQLLAFARVFLKDPGLVVLDEASSRLDPATERLIERAVDGLLRGRTAIVIAHRLGTVARADTVMILERGRLIERGEREALARDPSSRFHGLLRTGMEAALA